MRLHSACTLILMLQRTNHFFFTWLLGHVQLFFSLCNDRTWKHLSGVESVMHGTFEPTVQYLGHEVTWSRSWIETCSVFIPEKTSQCRNKDVNVTGPGLVSFLCLKISLHYRIMLQVFISICVIPKKQTCPLQFHSVHDWYIHSSCLNTNWAIPHKLYLFHLWFAPNLRSF